jgi:hypothetical protein
MERKPKIVPLWERRLVTNKIVLVKGQEGVLSPRKPVKST